MKVLQEFVDLVMRFQTSLAESTLCPRLKVSSYIERVILLAQEQAPI